MRYESAWRMGQWNSPFDQAEVTPGQPVGTNQAIQGCLKVRQPLPEKRISIMHSVNQHCDNVLGLAYHFILITLMHKMTRCEDHAAELTQHLSPCQGLLNGC